MEGGYREILRDWAPAVCAGSRLPVFAGGLDAIALKPATAEIAFRNDHDSDPTLWYESRRMRRRPEASVALRGSSRAMEHHVSQGGNTWAKRQAVEIVSRYTSDLAGCPKPLLQRLLHYDTQIQHPCKSNLIDSPVFVSGESLSSIHALPVPGQSLPAVCPELLKLASTITCISVSRKIPVGVAITGGCHLTSFSLPDLEFPDEDTPSADVLDILRIPSTVLHASISSFPASSDCAVLDSSCFVSILDLSCSRFQCKFRLKNYEKARTDWAQVAFSNHPQVIYAGQTDSIWRLDSRIGVSRMTLSLKGSLSSFALNQDQEQGSFSGSSFLLGASSDEEIAIFDTRWIGKPMVSWQPLCSDKCPQLKFSRVSGVDVLLSASYENRDFSVYPFSQQRSIGSHPQVLGSFDCQGIENVELRGFSVIKSNYAETFKVAFLSERGNLFIKSWITSESSESLETSETSFEPPPVILESGYNPVSDGYKLPEVRAQKKPPWILSQATSTLTATSSNDYENNEKLNEVIYSRLKAPSTVFELKFFCKKQGLEVTVFEIFASLNKMLKSSRINRCCVKTSTRNSKDSVDEHELLQCRCLESEDSMKEPCDSSGCLLLSAFSFYRPDHISTTEAVFENEMSESKSGIQDLSLDVDQLMALMTQPEDDVVEEAAKTKEDSLTIINSLRNSWNTSLSKIRSEDQRVSHRFRRPVSKIPEDFKKWMRINRRKSGNRRKLDQLQSAYVQSNIENSEVAQDVKEVTK